MKRVILNLSQNLKHKESNKHTWEGTLELVLFFILKKAVVIGLGRCLLRKPLQPVWKWPFGKPQSHDCCYACQAFTLVMLNMELSDIQARSILNFWKNQFKSIRKKAGRNVYNMHVKATFKYDIIMKRTLK